MDYNIRAKVAEEYRQKLARGGYNSPLWEGADAQTAHICETAKTDEEAIMELRKAYRLWRKMSLSGTFQGSANYLSRLLRESRKDRMKQESKALEKIGQTNLLKGG